ncbi:608_t:CDS:2 [Funneliformis caledonium]|nr:608_t:CDS:2 [Funneliformis caledonium]
MPSGICRQNAFFEDDFPVAEEEARTFREYHERMSRQESYSRDKAKLFCARGVLLVLPDLSNLDQFLELELLSFKMFYE